MRDSKEILSKEDYKAFAAQLVNLSLEAVEKERQSLHEEAKKYLNSAEWISLYSALLWEAAKGKRVFTMMGSIDKMKPALKRALQLAGFDVLGTEGSGKTTIAW